MDYLPGPEVNHLCLIDESLKKYNHQLSYLKWERYDMNKKNVKSEYIILIITLFFPMQQKYKAVP